MTTQAGSNRPVFNSLDEDLGEEIDRAPMSKLAVASCIFGVFSLLAPLSYVLLPLSVVAVALGAVVLIHISRDKTVSGAWLAQIGLGLGVMTAVWSTFATRGDADHLTEHGTKFAKEYLSYISNDEPFKALALQQFESERQLEGTDLEAYYANAPESVRSKFLDSPETVLARKAGKDADWQLRRVIGIRRTAMQGDEIDLQMYNAADPELSINVHLLRNEQELNGKRSALWMVREAEIPIDSDLLLNN